MSYASSTPALAREKTRLLVACPWGPATSPKTISGVACYLIPELQRHFEVLVADPELYPFTFTPYERARLLAGRIYRRLMQPPRPVFPGALYNTTHKFSTWVNQQVKRLQPDALLTFGYSPVVELQHKLPAYLYVDYAFQFKAADGIFDWIKPEHLSKAEMREVINTDRAGLQNCRRVFTTSPKIAAGIARYYPEFTDKLVSVGIGANLIGLPTAHTKRTLDQINLIFISTNFERKGGHVTLAVFRELKKDYPNLSLHLVGDLPAEKPTDAGIVVHGWMDKNNPAEREKLHNLLRQSHVQILPTRGDLTPHSICEMNAYGIPTVSRIVGGIPDLVEDGVSGILVKDESVNGWLNAVKQVLANYDSFSVQAFQKYAREQTWEVVANQLAQHIEATK